MCEMKTKLLLFALFLGTWGMMLSAQVRNTRDYITIRLVPSHSDWNYRLAVTPQRHRAARGA